MTDQIMIARYNTTPDEKVWKAFYISHAGQSSLLVEAPDTPVGRRSVAIAAVYDAQRTGCGIRNMMDCMSMFNHLAFAAKTLGVKV